MANFELGKDRNGAVNFIVASDPFAHEATELATNVEQTLTVPGNAGESILALVGYEPGANVFVDPDGGVVALLLPTASFADYKGFQTRPGFYVTAGDIMHFISDTTAFIEVSFYVANPANG
jgi:hypothetical protein